jgi:hypothetical protein
VQDHPASPPIAGKDYLRGCLHRLAVEAVEAPDRAHDWTVRVLATSLRRWGSVAKPTGSALASAPCWRAQALRPGGSGLPLPFSRRAQALPRRPRAPVPLTLHSDRKPDTPAYLERSLGHTPGRSSGTCNQFTRILFLCLSATHPRAEDEEPYLSWGLISGRTTRRGDAPPGARPKIPAPVQSTHRRRSEGTGVPVPRSPAIPHR